MITPEQTQEFREGYFENPVEPRYVDLPAAGHLGIIEERCEVSTHNLLLLNDGLHCPQCRAAV